MIMYSGITDSVFYVFRVIDNDHVIFLNCKKSLRSAKDFIRSYYRKGQFTQRIEFLIESPYHSYHVICTEQCHLFSYMEGNSYA